MKKADDINYGGTRLRDGKPFFWRYPDRGSRTGIPASSGAECISAKWLASALEERDDRISDPRDEEAYRDAQVRWAKSQIMLSL